MKSPLPTNRLVVLSLVAVVVGVAASVALAVPSVLSVRATGSADASAAPPQDAPPVGEPRWHFDDDDGGGG